MIAASWLGQSFAQTGPVFSFSNIHSTVRIDSLVPIYELVNEKQGRVLKAADQQTAKACVLYFTVVNDLDADTTFYFTTADNGWIRLVLKDESGHAILEEVTGSNQPIQKRFGQDEEYFLPVRVKAGKTITATVILQAAFSFPADPACYLYSPLAYNQYYKTGSAIQNTQENIIIFFTGATLMLFLFFCFMYVESRQALYGRYAFYLALQWLWGMLKLGPATLIGYATMHAPVLRYVMQEPLVLAAVGGYTWFVIELLGLRYQSPKLDRLLKWVAYIIWAYCILFVIVMYVFPAFPFRRIAFIITRGTLILVNIYVLFAIAFGVKSTVKKYYLIGNILFLGFAIISGFQGQLHIFSTGYLSRFSVASWYMIGVLLECIFFAFGLGIRIKELQQREQESDHKLIEQMQVSEKLTMEINQQLEQKVTERTEKIRRQAAQLEEVRMQETKAAYEKQLSETRMQALRSRMNPHFIFNSLNSIKYFILKKENDTAEFYLNKFSRLLRLILDYTTHETITLQQELEALNVYLEIESVRFDKSFHYHIHVDESVNTDMVHIPPLLLQPFVENAIWHGLANSDKNEKYCHIEISRQNGTVLMQIKDNGVGRNVSAGINANKPNKHISHGMKITEDRVTLFNNTKQGILNIEIQDNMEEPEDPSGTVVNITFKNETSGG